MALCTSEQPSIKTYSWYLCTPSISFYHHSCSPVVKLKSYIRPWCATAAAAVVCFFRPKKTFLPCNQICGEGQRRNPSKRRSGRRDSHADNGLCIEDNDVSAFSFFLGKFSVHYICDPHSYFFRPRRGDYSAMLQILSPCTGYVPHTNTST